MSDYKPKHIKGEIPLFETQLPHTHSFLTWGHPNPRERAQAKYAWHVLNCMVAFRLSIQPEEEDEQTRK